MSLVPPRRVIETTCMIEALGVAAGCPPTRVPVLMWMKLGLDWAVPACASHWGGGEDPPLQWSSEVRKRQLVEQWRLMGVEYVDRSAQPGEDQPTMCRVCTQILYMPKPLDS